MSVVVGTLKRPGYPGMGRFPMVVSVLKTPNLTRRVTLGFSVVACWSNFVSWVVATTDSYLYKTTNKGTCMISTHKQVIRTRRGVFCAQVVWGSFVLMFATTNGVRVCPFKDLDHRKCRPFCHNQ